MNLLKNFRRGFATNSSSSHSFVYLKEPSPHAKDPAISTDGEFGWDDFRLDSIVDKLFYVLVSIIGSNGWGANDVEEDYAKYKDQFPEFDIQTFAFAQTGYVDHQSKGTIDTTLARDPYVVVFGGNDNGADNGADSSMRYSSVVSEEIDWTRTDPDWYAGDLDNAPDADKKIIAQRLAAQGSWNKERIEENYPGLLED